MFQALFFAEARVVWIVGGDFLESLPRYPLLREGRSANRTFAWHLLVHELAVHIILVPRREAVEPVCVGIPLPFLQGRPFPELGFVLCELAVGHREP
jgi:hypothetical protein